MTAPEARVLDSTLRFELCRESDVPALMEFIGTEWRAGHILSRDEDLLRWQFAPELLHGRRASGPTVLLAWLDGTIVGMLGLTGFDLTVLGDRYPAIWLSHWFAAPAYRRYSVALRLLWAARDLGIDALVTLGANDVSTRLLTRLGLELIPSLPRWVGVFDVAGAVELVRAAGREVSLQDAEQLCRRHLVAPPEATALPGGFGAVGWSPSTAAAWNRFWGERLAPRLVGATRDDAYLQWRYVAHPRFAYQVRVARRDTDGAVEGLLVFRAEQVEGVASRVLRVVEFLATPAAEPCLVRSLLEAAREAGAAGADFYCSSAHAARALARAGFRREAADAPVPFPSRLQPLESGVYPMTTLVRLPGVWRPTLGRLMTEGCVYITKADGDQDRPN